MADYELDPAIRGYYATTRDEATRLTATADGRLELVRTQELLRRHLPAAPARVLDIGGGTGTHARWLTEDGHDVDLIDPIEDHVRQAREAGFHATIGDARALDTADHSYDVVLMAGPLYHLINREDRRRALCEARRVLRPGGLLAGAAISRYASIFENVATSLLARDVIAEQIADILKTGILRTPRALGSAYFHTPDNLRAELTEAGFDDVTVYSIEGPGWSALKATEENSGNSLQDSAMFTAALTAARLAENYPDLLAAGSHLLAVGVPADDG